MEKTVLQPDLDSELSSDEEIPPLPNKRARLASEPTETAKDGTVWREEQVGKRLHFTPIEPYPTAGEPRASVRSHLQSFLCFITLDMLRSIQEWTTQHARHTEQDPSRPNGERLSETVVMRLMEPFMDKGRTVTTDNFFTSFSLAQRLLSRKTAIVGTVNKSRQEIPQSATQMDRTEFTTQVFSTTGATLTVYAPKWKKVVYILSSMHSVVETEDTTKRKPNTVTQYNNTKCGVDVMDQMREYSVRAGTRRWPVAVFYNMIDMAALNAHVLYQACTGVQERRVDFLVELAKELGDSHVSEKKARKEKLLRQRPSTPSPGKRAKCQVNHRCTNNCATVRCVDCYKYTCGKCTRDIPWQCQVSSDSADRLLRSVTCTEWSGTLNRNGNHSVLQSHAVPSGTCLVGQEFILQQDNDPKRNSKLHQSYLRKKEQDGKLENVE
ncbi:hypothetical protein SRHO_G00329230 [Serrasalmus rhombeus]